MIKITSIKPKKKNQFFAEFENGDTMMLHQNTVFKYGLLQKKPLDQATFDAIKNDDAFNQLMQKALNQLAKQDMSISALKKSLSPAKPMILNQVIDHLKTQGYLDEEKALQRYVDEMIEFGDKGPKHLEEKLKKEGYLYDAIKRHLKRYSETIEKQKINMILDKQLKNLDQLTTQKKREKMLRFLYARGFHQNLFIPILEAKLSDAYDEDAEATLLEKRYHTLKNRYDLNDFKDKQKLMKKLLNEGFKYDLIKTYLS